MRTVQDKSSSTDPRAPMRQESRIKFWHPATPDPREESRWERGNEAGHDWLDEWTLKPRR